MFTCHRILKSIFKISISVRFFFLCKPWLTLFPVKRYKLLKYWWKLYNEEETGRLINIIYIPLSYLWSDIFSRFYVTLRTDFNVQIKSWKIFVEFVETEDAFFSSWGAWSELLQAASRKLCRGGFCFRIKNCVIWGWKFNTLDVKHSSLTARGWTSVKAYDVLD